MEDRVANDPAKLQQRGDEERREREVQTWAKLLSCFPKPYHERILVLVREHRRNLCTAHPALSRLYFMIWHQEWEPQPFPEPLAQVYVEDKQALAWRKCQNCGLPLPVKYGYWTRPGVKGWWYDRLRYFDQCPGCGGEIVNWSRYQAEQGRSSFPARPNEQFRFQEDNPDGTPAYTTF